jgi:hypothetical protein
VKGKAFLFDVPQALRSRNEVIRYLHDHLFLPGEASVCPDEIISAVKEMLDINFPSPSFPEIVPIRQRGESNSSACL